MHDFPRLSKRIDLLRQRLFSTVSEVFSERAKIVTEMYRQTHGQQFVMRRAKAFRAVLEHMEINIAPGELVVGTSTGTVRGCQVFPEYDMGFVIDELDTFEKRTADRFKVSEENKRELREIHEFWRGNSVADSAWTLFDVEQRSCAEDLVFILTALRSGVGHIIVDYQSVLREGISGIRKRIGNLIAALDLNDDSYANKKLHYVAASLCCDAIVLFANRYADLAEELAVRENDAERKKELLAIGLRCRRVPEFPASDFTDALQSFWFVHLGLHLESNGHSISPGRFDQYMYPFWQGDIEQGVHRETLFEWLQALWLKFFEVNKVRDKVSSKAFGGYPMFQNLVVGGQDDRGRSAVNDLSYACLDATAALRIPQPSLSVRWFEGCENRFLSRAFDVVELGMGMPALFNDEVLIPNMLQMGYSLIESRDYGIVGCTETTGQGNVEPWLTGGFLNALKVLELTIFNGIDPVNGTQHSLCTGPVESMERFKDFLAAYKLQLEWYVSILVGCDNILDSSHGAMCPNPFQSLFIRGCLENGKSSLEGGALYNSTTIEVVGLPNVCDSLEAVRRLIYEEKSLSWDSLRDALASNYHNDLLLQVYLRNKGAKYGNDNDQVDSIGADLVDFLYEVVQKYRSPRGGSYRLALYSVASHALFATKTGATPDGRASGEVLADGGVSCAQGRDTEGLTALLNSVLRLDSMKALGSCLLNVRLSPALLRGEAKDKLMDTIRTFFLLKGQHIQFNVFDSATLREAQVNPDRYPTLMVRVAGFSVLFNTIDRLLQDDIIARTEQAEGGRI
jgi:pyruvate formate-lyase/glycerol dehydratase family glycyl radical enzyme